VLLAAGDVADCAYEGAALTAEILADHPESTIAVLGDLAYPDATAERFDACYDPTWGAFVDRTRPALGNHDLNADAGAPYYATFGDAAGTPGEGWYSYQLGEWHVVVLNSNCDRVGCGEGSPQHDWLVADLAQAEAVLDVIRARTDAAQRVAMEGLRGRLSEAVGVVRSTLLSALAYLVARNLPWWPFSWLAPG